MTKKDNERDAAKFFLEHYNSLHSTSYKVDEEYLNDRPEGKFPDILLKTGGKQVKELQIEVGGIHAAKAEIESQKRIFEAIKNRLQAESISNKIIKVIGFKNPKNKGKKAFIQELVLLTKNQKSFPATIITGNSKKCNYPSLKKYSREISINQYKRNKVRLFHDTILMDGPGLIGKAINKKERHYSDKEKGKTILLLHDETFAGDKDDVKLYINENPGTLSGFKEIWRVDMTTGDVQKIR